MKTPEEIAAEVADRKYIGTYTNSRDIGGNGFRRAIAKAAIEADRAQRQPEIYIVQNDTGDVVDVFRDADEATAIFQEGYSIIEETVSEPGERAARMIEEYTADWEAATGDTASDYMLSEDDWKVGLDDVEAGQIARLIEWREARK